MTPLAAVFMALSWTLVLGLAIWSWRRVLRVSEARRNSTTADQQDDRLDEIEW
jgi:hypothetical protein